LAYISLFELSLPPLRARYAMVASVGLSSVRCPSRGYILNTTQDRQTRSMLLWNTTRNLIPMIMLPHSCPPPRRPPAGVVNCCKQTATVENCC